jgi:hypothetical protein
VGTSPALKAGVFLIAFKRAPRWPVGILIPVNACQKSEPGSGLRTNWRDSESPADFRHPSTYGGMEVANRITAPETGISSMSLQKEQTEGMALRITLIQTEVGMTPVFLRLAAQADDRSRTRVLRGALPMLLELDRWPGWFHALPEASGWLPRSLTVRLTLSEADPVHRWMMANLRGIPASERPRRIKEIMVRALAEDGQAAAAPGQDTRPPDHSTSWRAPSESPESTQDGPQAEASDEEFKKRLFQNSLNALKGFMIPGPVGDQAD